MIDLEALAADGRFDDAEDSGSELFDEDPNPPGTPPAEFDELEDPFADGGGRYDDPDEDAEVDSQVVSSLVSMALESKKGS